MINGAILKLIQVFLLATVKYSMTLPYALVIGLDYPETILTAIVGGMTGFYFFYRISGLIINYFNKHLSKIHFAFKKYFKIDILSLFKRKDKKRQIFTKKMRLIIKLKNNYGFWGIIISTPILLSFPIGAFLLKKYYSKNKNIFPYMLLSVIGWCLIFSTIFVIFPK